MVLEGGGVDLPTLLMKEGHARLSNMDSNDRMAKFMKSSSYVELVDDVVSLMGFHVGVTIFEYISYPLLFRMRYLLCLEYRK